MTASEIPSPPSLYQVLRFPRGPSLLGPRPSGPLHSPSRRPRPPRPGHRGGSALKREALGVSGASDPGGVATRPDPTHGSPPPSSLPVPWTAARTAALPTDAHFQLRRAPPGMRENPAAPRSDRAPDQSAGRGREATPLRPWGGFPPGTGRSAVGRAAEDRGEAAPGRR